MERRGMARQSKREYLESIYVRYRQSGRAEKQRILDEFVRVCGYHRKYAIEQVWACANRVTRQPRATAPRMPQPRGVTPWRGWTFSAKVKQDRQQQRASASAR